MSKIKLDQFDFIDFNDDNNNNSIAITDLLEVIWRNRFWFTLSLVIASIIAVIYVRSTPKSYSRTATILIKDDKKGGGGVSEAAAFQDMFSFGSNSVYNEIGVLQSRRLMMRVVEQLSLEASYRIKDGLRLKDIYTSSPIEIEYLDDIAAQGSFNITVTPLGGNRARLTYIVSEIDHNGAVDESEIIEDVSFDSVIASRYGKIKIKPTIFMDQEFVGKDIFVTKESVKDVAKSYGQKLSVVSNDKQSTLVNLSIIETNPQRAEDIINTLVNVYEKNSIEHKNEVLNSTINFISEKVNALEGDLKLIDSNIEEYKKRNKLTDITSVSSMYLENSSRIDAEALGLENQLSIATYMKEYLQNNSNQTELMPVNIGINNSGIESQVARYNEAMTLRNKLLTNSSTNNPIVRDLQASLVSTRSSILNAIDNLIASLKIQVKKYSSEEAKSNSKIANVSSQHKYMINIDRQLKIKEELYLYLLKKREESEIQLTTTESNCIIVDVADGSGNPIAPNKVLVVLISLILGLLAPAIWLYIRSLLNTSIQTKADIKSIIDIPFVGELPLEKSNDIKKLLVVEDGNRNVINEAFRLVRDNIEMMDIKCPEKGRVILVTSFNPSAGKTFITSNLALTMSLSNVKVVLVDIDLRKGSLGKRFGFDKKTAGLTTYLSGKIDDIDGIINRYHDSNLDIISSGALPPNPAELLKNIRLEELFAKLRERYDYIIIDSAPYGLVTDTSIIAKHVDMSVIVVRSGVFDKRQLPALAELYRSNSLNNLCVLLNAVDIDSIGYGYGYGYGNEVAKDFRYYTKKILGI